MLDHEGVPVEDRKQTYAIAFAVYALAEYRLATGREEPLALALALRRALEAHARDPEHGGYWEARARDWGPLADVRLSDNLGSHPVSVVPDGGMTFEMEKYFKRMNPEAGMKADRILELNADHPIFAKLQIAVAQDEKKAEDLVNILYTQALLMAGLPVENAGEYTDLVCSLIG